MARKHEAEYRRFSRPIHLRVVRERQKMNKRMLIGLVLCHIRAELGDKRLAKPFHLTVGLGMIGAYRQTLDA